MPNPGEDGDADERLLREEAAARRALSMALLAISTAADDCHIEEEEKSFMVMVWIYRIATTRLPSTLLLAVYRDRLGLLGRGKRVRRFTMADSPHPFLAPPSLFSEKILCLANRGGALSTMAKRKKTKFEIQLFYLPPPAAGVARHNDTITMTTQIDGIDHRRRGRDAARLT